MTTTGTISRFADNLIAVGLGCALLSSGCGGALSSAPPRRFESGGLLDRAPRPEQLSGKAIGGEDANDASPDGRAPRPSARVSVDRPPRSPREGTADRPGASAGAPSSSSPEPDAAAPGGAPSAAAGRSTAPDASAEGRSLARLEMAAAGWGNPVTVADPPDGAAGWVVTLKKGEGEKSPVEAPLPASLRPVAGETLAVTASARRGEGGTALSLACAVRLENGRYLESPSKPIDAEDRTVLFRFSQAYWKSEDTDWQHSAALADPTAIRRIGFVIYGGASGAQVRIAHPHLTGDPRGAAPGAVQSASIPAACGLTGGPAWAIFQGRPR